MCTVGDADYVCLSGPSAYALGDYIEAVNRYHSDVLSCPYVKEIIIPTTDLSGAVEAGKELVEELIK